MLFYQINILEVASMLILSATLVLYYLCACRRIVIIQFIVMRNILLYAQCICYLTY